MILFTTRARLHRFASCPEHFRVIEVGIISDARFFRTVSFIHFAPIFRLITGSGHRLFQFSDRTFCASTAAGLLTLIQSRVRPDR